MVAVLPGIMGYSVVKSELIKLRVAECPERRLACQRTLGRCATDASHPGSSSDT